MSRVGKLPISLPNGVTITIDNDLAKVSGPKGNLEQLIVKGITVQQDGDQYFVKRSSDSPEMRSKHGLVRALINNMVLGVSEGFSKRLELHGVGYRVSLSGTDLKLNIGYSHEVTYKLPQGITALVEQNTIVVSGINKQQVGQCAAEIRSLRKPEPYKGKGIRYTGERIIRKSGKSGKE